MSKYPHVPFGEVGTVIAGQHIEASFYNRTGDGTPYLTGPDDFGDVCPIVSKWTRCPKVFAMDTDVLLTVKGAGAGKCNLAVNAAIGRQLMALRPEKSRLDRHFLFRTIQAFERQLSQLGQGATVPGIAKPAVERFPIPLPPLSEQKRIAAILDQADAIRRKRHAAAEATAALIPAGFCEMFGDPGKNPRYWPIVEMGEVVQETQYGTSSALEVEKRRYPVLRMNNITYSGDWQLNDLKWLDFGNGDVAKYTVRRGDLLFNRTNSPELVGKTAVWPYEETYGFAGYLIRVRFDESRVLPEFVSSYLNSRFGKSLLFKSAIPSNNMSNISASTFRRLPLVLPPVEMQEKFAEYQDQVQESTGRQRIAENECDALFHALVHRAFRGEL